MDVDALAAHVDRAAELLRFCRARLVATEAQVTQVVADLGDLGLDAGPPDAAADGADAPGPGVQDA